MSPGSNYYPAMPGSIGILNPFLPQDDASGREIRAFNKLSKLFNRGFRVINEIRNGITYLPEIMRGNIGSHANGNSRTAVNQ
ncbi:hypothetical protein ES705_34881 [subsurface metagenome]